MLRACSAFAIGLVFGVGILLSGMADPAKVLNFFDVFGTWDPSLIFVMGGALFVTAIGYRFVFRMPAPVLSASFHVPTRKDVDRQLLVGSAIFGIGWGLSGFCPGGLVPAIGLGVTGPVITTVAILAGMIALRVITGIRVRQAAASSS